MSIKIFHTADLHIGMKYNSYPEPIKSALQRSRVDVLQKMVDMANQQECNLFVVAGDLFHNIKGIDKKTVAQSAQYLESFQGECVLVMPGNHDYDNDMIDLWKTFNNNVVDKILFLNQEVPVPLQDFGLDITIYPAPCHSKHSAVNNLGWIREQSIDPQQINIGIAHGSLEGISPDLDSSYFYMGIKELEDLPVDLWLLGHTHVTYPTNQSIKEWRIFNPGTPEPDGLDCQHSGIAWIITIDEQKKTEAFRIDTGIYRFSDQEYAISRSEDLDKLQTDLLEKTPSRTIARIHLSGRVDEDTFNYRQDVFREIDQALGYLIIDDANLGLRITRDKINKDFIEGSFPQQFLSALSDDEDALQLAYELVMEVKK